MAGSLSNAFETSVLQWLFTTASPSPVRPTAWHVGLFTDGNGQTVDQPVTEATNSNCPGYARQTASFSVVGDTATNTNAQIFTASGAWATVYCFGVWDAPTNGNLIAWGTITAKTLANTDQLKFDVGQITINMD